MTSVRRTALVAIFAILFQAILFGWHHHDLEQVSSGPQPVAHTKGTAPLSPTGAADDCDICQTLHHLTAAPGVLAAAITPPSAIGSLTYRPNTVVSVPYHRRAFRARAPPRA
jgi:hypothetical protein